MARIPRCAFPAVGVYHVTTRGVAKMRIVLDDADRSRWSRLFRVSAARFRWTVYAYCLLDNHFHIVVGAILEDLSRGMHRLNGMYAQRFNERHVRVGHLYQERFHTQLIRDDEHLVEACDYVLANPVRAGLSATPREWPWSGGLVVSTARASGAGVDQRQGRSPRAERGHVSIPPVQEPVAERVLGLHQLVDLSRSLVDDRRARVAEVPF